MLADAQGARVAAYLLEATDRGGDESSYLVVGNGSAHAHREGARPPRRAGGGVRRRAGRVAPGRPTRRSTSTWPASCGRAWTRSVELGELDDDLGAAQVDYDDAPFGVQYWVMRWESSMDRAERAERRRPRRAVRRRVAAVAAGQHDQHRRRRGHRAGRQERRHQQRRRQAGLRHPAPALRRGGGRRRDRARRGLPRRSRSRWSWSAAAARSPSGFETPRPARC